MNKTIKGFTIIELVVVVSVLGVLASVGMVAFSGVQDDARDSLRLSSMKVVSEALEKYYDKNGEYPDCSSMTTQPASSVTTSTLQGMDSTVLTSPSGSTGANSISGCTTISGQGPDIYAYVPVAPVCGAITTIVGYTLQYRNTDGSIGAVTGRKKSKIIASGGDVTTSGGYRTHTFSSATDIGNRTFSVSSAGLNCFEITIDGAGGGGGGMYNFGSQIDGIDGGDTSLQNVVAGISCTSMGGDGGTTTDSGTAPDADDGGTDVSSCISGLTGTTGGAGNGGPRAQEDSEHGGNGGDGGRIHGTVGLDSNQYSLTVSNIGSGGAGGIGAEGYEGGYDGGPGGDGFVTIKYLFN